MANKYKSNVPWWEVEASQKPPTPPAPPPFDPNNPDMALDGKPATPEEIRAAQYKALGRPDPNIDPYAQYRGTWTNPNEGKDLSASKTYANPYDAAKAQNAGTSASGGASGGASGSGSGASSSTASTSAASGQDPRAFIASWAQSHPSTPESLREMVKAMKAAGIPVALATHAGGSQASDDKIVLPGGQVVDLLIDSGRGGWTYSADPNDWYGRANRVMDADGNFVTYGDFADQYGFSARNGTAPQMPSGGSPSYLGLPSLNASDLMQGLDSSLVSTEAVKALMNEGAGNRPTTAQTASAPQTAPAGASKSQVAPLSSSNLPPAVAAALASLRPIDTQALLAMMAQRTGR